MAWRHGYSQDGGSTKVVTLMRRVFPEKDFGRPQLSRFNLGTARSQHIDTDCLLVDVSYCAASAVGHVHACNTLRSSLWILMNSIRGWELNIEPATEATFQSSSVRLNDCVLLPWQGGTRIRWRDEDASWGSRLRHLFHREKLFHVPKSLCQRSNNVKQSR